MDGRALFALAASLISVTLALHALWHLIKIARLQARARDQHAGRGLAGPIAVGAAAGVAVLLVTLNPVPRSRIDMESSLLGDAAGPGTVVPSTPAPGQTADSKAAQRSDRLIESLQADVVALPTPSITRGTVRAPRGDAHARTSPRAVEPPKTVPPRMVAAGVAPVATPARSDSGAASARSERLGQEPLAAGVVRPAAVQAPADGPSALAEEARRPDSVEGSRPPVVLGDDRPRELDPIVFDRRRRPERPERFDRPVRVERVERVERIDRPERVERMDRPERVERVERPERVERRERFERPERRQRRGD